MLAPSEILRFGEVCQSISNHCADESGFIPIRNLLRHFNARLIFRPLLVEGMLATATRRDGQSNSTQDWVVLVDSEKFHQTLDDIENESTARPLPSRLRNTIAHELVHSLAFRHSEFSIKLQYRSDEKKSQTALVRDIENATERLSPLLLWSEKALNRLIKNAKQVISIDDLVLAGNTMGLSRYVLINRLQLLNWIDKQGLLGSVQIRDLAVGLGEWSDTGQVSLKNWPLFLHFDRGLAPDFLIQVQREGNLGARGIFQDLSFMLGGGSATSTRFKTPAGPEQFEVEFNVESHEKRPGSRFLYTVHRTASLIRRSPVAPEASARRQATSVIRDEQIKLI